MWETHYSLTEGQIMLKVITDETKIKDAQLQFLGKLEQHVDRRILVIIGFQGESFNRTISYSHDLDIWFFSEIIPGKRYVNAFGIGKPKENSHITNACEINFPLKDINRRTGGAFVEDHNKDIFVIHRGKIGGGRPGIGKSFFANNYNSKWVSVNDDGIEKTVALIGQLNSSIFAKGVKDFVFEMNRLKGI